MVRVRIIVGIKKMKLKNVFFVSAILVQCCFLFSYEFSCNENNKNSTPQAEIYVNSQRDASPKNNWNFSAQARKIPDYSSMQRANYSIVTHGSPELQHYFYEQIRPLIHNATIKNHCCVLPGYVSPDGLRSCINQLSQFSVADALLVSELKSRLETYCNRIEEIIWSGKNGTFCDTLCQAHQIKLVKIYADFLKEFYADAAPYMFYDQSQKSSLMQQVMPTIHWQYFDGSAVKTKSKTLAQHQVASVNGNLGAVYKALHEGDFEKANNIGFEEVTVGVGRHSEQTSVFERYPALQQKVDSYFAKAMKDRQDYIAKEKEAEQQAAVVQAECVNHGLQQSHFDTLQQRCDAAMVTILDSQSATHIHTITDEQATYISVDHLTSDQKGILLNGNHLQHHLVDEVITVVDAVVSVDLTENMHDAVIDFANVSLDLNKNGDVVMAARTLDACWALVDFAKDAARYTYSTLSTHVPLIAKGACDGVCESLHSTMHMICHPLQAAQDVVNSLVVAGYYLGKLAYADCVLEAATDLLDTDPQQYQKMVQEYAINPEALAAVYENVTTEDVARVGTKVVVDMMLLHGITKVVSAIATESLPTFLSCMRKGGESAEVAMTAEGVPVRCAEEAACLMQKMEPANAKVAAGTIDTGAKNAAIKKYGKQGSPYQKISKSTQHERPLNRLEGKDLLGIDNIVLSGYGPLPKSISLDNYKHYLQPELRITSKGKIKPSGWHHDSGRRMEAIRRIDGHKIEIVNYEKHASGIYKFEWGVEGMQKKRSTFFPHAWSRELIQKKIVEAYKYARKYNTSPQLQQNSNFLLSGFTKDGMEITMIIDQRGTIVSAYPKW
jgi:hypothetical protein